MAGKTTPNPFDLMDGLTSKEIDSLSTIKLIAMKLGRETYRNWSLDLVKQSLEEHKAVGWKESQRPTEELLSARRWLIEQYEPRPLNKEAKLIDCFKKHNGNWLMVQGRRTGLVRIHNLYPQHVGKITDLTQPYKHSLGIIVTKDTKDTFKIGLDKLTFVLEQDKARDYKDLTLHTYYNHSNARQMRFFIEQDFNTKIHIACYKKPKMDSRWRVSRRVSWYRQDHDRATSAIYEALKWVEGFEERQNLMKHLPPSLEDLQEAKQKLEDFNHEWKEAATKQKKPE